MPKYRMIHQKKIKFQFKTIAQTILKKLTNEAKMQIKQLLDSLNLPQRRALEFPQINPPKRV